MSESNSMNGSFSGNSNNNPILDFEWNMFEQSQQPLDWYHTPTENSVPSESSSSPEEISYSTPESTSTMAPNDTPSTPRRASRGPPKSPSTRTKRQSQNREAQRAFRVRQRQRFEELETELALLRSNYRSLQDRYSSLNLLYMERLNHEGSSWSVDSELGAPADSQVLRYEALQYEPYPDLELQQSDVAAWLSATTGQEMWKTSC